MPNVFFKEILKIIKLKKTPQYSVCVYANVTQMQLLLLEKSEFSNDTSQ